eukprot:15437863-Alexandrium_andersonii.AAC.1
MLRDSSQGPGTCTVIYPCGSKRAWGQRIQREDARSQHAQAAKRPSLRTGKQRRSQTPDSAGREAGGAALCAASP